MTVIPSLIQAAHQAMLGGTLTAERLVSGCIARIQAHDQDLHAVVATSSVASGLAQKLDTDLARTGELTGPLHGIPVVIKDNFHTVDMPTRGGAIALSDTLTEQESTITHRLRAAGAIMLAKTNMHELALAGTTVSSLGGQTLNPYDLTRTPGGSSGGTGVALAASYGMVGLGTDTVNSVRSPASANCLVGLRPTRGLVSRANVMPVAETQDAAGPLTLTVTDAARVMDVIAGFDPADPVTARACAVQTGGYEAALAHSTLQGVRIGVMRALFGDQPENKEVNHVMATAMALMQDAGAVLIDIQDECFNAEHIIEHYDVQRWEFKEQFNAYLTQRGAGAIHSLTDLIEDGRFHKPTLEQFLLSANAITDRWSEPEYLLRLVKMTQLRDRLLWQMAQHEVQAVVYPLQQCLVVPADGSSQVQRNGIVAAVTGLPAITVPAGFSSPTDSAPLGVPVGMDMLSRPFHETKLLQLAYAFEQRAAIHRPPRGIPFFPELFST